MKKGFSRFEQMLVASIFVVFAIVTFFPLPDDLWPTLIFLYLPCIWAGVVGFIFIVKDKL